MAHIGEVITQADLTSLKKWSEQDARVTGYVAPEIYKLASSKFTGWSVWLSLDNVTKHHDYVTGVKGATAVKAAAAISFTKPGIAESMGINVDFFVKLPAWGLLPVPYAGMRDVFSNAKFDNFPVIVRFYKTNGVGPFYSIITPKNIGITATLTKNFPSTKLLQYDAFYREVQLLKANYNRFADFVDKWSKKQKNVIQQQQFDEALTLMLNMREQMRDIKGIDVKYSSTGQVSGIGIAPVVIWIAIICISALAWGGLDLLAEKEKTNRLNDNYNYQKWITAKQQELAADLKAGKISQDSYDQINKSLDDDKKKAQENAKEIIKDKPGILDKVEKVVSLALGIFALSQIIKSKNRPA